MTLAARDTPQPYSVPSSKQFDGNDGAWSTFDISVGTPGQGFRVLPSTKGGATYVIGQGGCIERDGTNCPQSRGIQVFQSTQSTGFLANESSTWSRIGQYSVDIEAALNVTLDGVFGFETVTLGVPADNNALSVNHSVIAQIADQGIYLGILPLGQAEQSFNTLSEPAPPLLEQLRNMSKIPSLSYGYAAGAKYREKSVYGSLILGGYDSTRFKPNANDFSFTFSSDASQLLTVAVGSMSATNTLQGQFSFTSNTYFSVIDSTVPELWLPLDVCKQFETAFGLTYDPSTDLYLVNDTIRSQLLSNNPTITIKLQNSQTATTTNYTNIELPYAAFDLQASYPIYDNATNYFPIRRAQNDSQYVLGRTLLQEAYLIVDYERGNFTVAPAVFSDPLPAANLVTITSHNSNSNNNNSSSSGLSTGAIVGIAIGGAAVLALAIGLFWFLRRRRAASKPHELQANSASETGSGQNLTPGTAAMKQVEPQELNGTPLTELASPHREVYSGGYPTDSKTVITPANEPQELHAESRTPITPRWEEVTLPRPLRDENDTGSGTGTNQSVSQVPSDDGWSGDMGPRSGVSPLTGQFHTGFPRR